MQERLITIAVSVAATFGLMQVAPERQRELDAKKATAPRRKIEP